MILKEVDIKNFRNFKKKKLNFSEKSTIIIGPNASGKTNILESIFLLSSGKSFKAKKEEEMVNHNEEVARCKGVFSDDKKLEAVLTRGEIKVGANKTEKAPRKRLLVNGVGKRLIDFGGLFKCVLFGPWDLDLVTESPSLRRKFLDTVLSQVDREYRRASLSYEKGLRRRNRILLRIREEGISRSNLLFWDKLLIKNGDYISQKREELISFINGFKSLDSQEFDIQYDKSAISPARLAQYKKEEVAAATTLVGPHRDDFCLRIKKREKFRDLDKFGSRGEQRMSILWLKLAELSFIEEKTNEKPTLLLDDIFSELDHAHREVVMKVAEEQQTIITTADPHFVKKTKKIAIIEI